MNENNARIVALLRQAINLQGIKYTFISEKTGIPYQRLMRLFHQNATISGSELLNLCKLLNIAQHDLMHLLDSIR